jgi:uncharacterized membrane protein YdbT with pleckstrin-like domain
MRWTLVALLTASTVLLAVGVIAERSSTDRHAEPAAARAAESRSEAAEPEDAHEGDEAERLLGVEVESTPLVLLAVVGGLALAALAATSVGAASSSWLLSWAWRGRPSTFARPSISSTSRAPASP